MRIPLHNSRIVAALLLGLLLISFNASAASAQDDDPDPDDTDEFEEFEEGDGFFDPSDIAPGTTPELDNMNELGPGSCSPASLGFQQATTCTFPLIGATVLPDYALHAAALAEGDNPWEPRGKSSRCSIVDESLVCPDLLAGFELGEFTLTVPQLIYSENPEPLATVSVDRDVDGVLGIIGASSRVTPVFANNDVEIEVFRSFAYDGNLPADIVLRLVGDDEIVAQVRALEPGTEDGSALVTFPGPGRYVVSSCAPAEVEGCTLEGIPYRYDAIAPDPIELVENHNGSPEDRINLVFIGSGFDPVDSKTLPEFARDLLALDGEPVPITDGVGGIWDLGWGPFSIDPLRGNAGKFNFWYLDDQTSASYAFVNGEFDDFNTLDTDALDLGPSVVPISVSKNGEVDGSRANANLPSFVDDAELPERAEIIFGSVFLPVSNFSVDHVVLAHEFGHALFGLRDEYEEPELTVPTLGYPNCVATEEEAQEIWGDLVGELDPMFERWQTTMAEAGVWFDNSEKTADNFTTSFTRGGCFATGSDAAVRPSAQSIMRDNDPVFGAANRRRVEQVLALFPEPPPPPPTTTSTTTTAAPTPTTTEAPTTSTSDPDTTELATPASGDDGSSDRIPIALIVIGGLLLTGGIAGLVVAARRPATPTI